MEAINNEAPKMSKKDWQELYGILDAEHSEFYHQYEISKHGKNQKLRSEADRKLDNIIRLSLSWISRRPESYAILLGEGSGMHKAINLDEFKQPRYFGGDMSKYLETIKSKIDSLE